MKIGLMSFNTEYCMPAHRIAQAAETRGFESLWLPEHTHIPVPQDGSNIVRDVMGGVLPEEYRHMSDPFVSLAAAAAVTGSLKLGTCICLINQHHPITLAKQVATLDHISQGRFIFGVGAGWNKGEMNDHGVRFEDRWPQVTERLDAMKTLWREEHASFAGKFIRFGASFSYPKPMQQPHPPIMLGTLDTDFGRAQVARHGDAWLPLTFNVARTGKSIADVHARMRNLGRDPNKLEVSLFFLEDKLQSAEIVSQARQTGASRIILRLPAKGEREVLMTLDHYATFLR